MVKLWSDPTQSGFPAPGHPPCHAKEGGLAFTAGTPFLADTDQVWLWPALIGDTCPLKSNYFPPSWDFLHEMQQCQGCRYLWSPGRQLQDAFGQARKHLCLRCSWNQQTRLCCSKQRPRWGPQWDHPHPSPAANSTSAPNILACDYFRSTPPNPDVFVSWTLCTLLEITEVWKKEIKLSVRHTRTSDLK